MQLNEKQKKIRKTAISVDESRKPKTKIEENPQTVEDTRTENPQFSSAKTEKPNQTLAKSAKPKIPTPFSWSKTFFL